MAHPSDHRLNPGVLRSVLVLVGLFLVAYIVGRPILRENSYAQASCSTCDCDCDSDNFSIPLDKLQGMSSSSICILGKVNWLTLVVMSITLLVDWLQFAKGRICLWKIAVIFRKFNNLIPLMFLTVLLFKPLPSFLDSSVTTQVSPSVLHAFLLSTLAVLCSIGSTSNCGKNDPDMNEEMEKDTITSLSEELSLQKNVTDDNLERTEALIMSTKRASSHYQKEAEKCNAGMETCEEAREKAEAALIDERKLSALWENRAREHGWMDQRRLYS
ncbi:hypothetical protein TEA_021241 [Camellia sinensis var. sinensis]|uniref:Uncharacterized protein n=1 Tax=Camellia sinensis var. sinensis TaxID=542762 RepID=A0A4S4EF61_CAMSN|nr:hypothetical protein TEA_021241 [Camellia sinensis var. sinensis]